jgi:hypothetical protein
MESTPNEIRPCLENKWRLEKALRGRTATFRQMIIYKFKEIPETRIGFPNSAFRWVFVIEKWSIGFEWQYKDKTNREWNTCHSQVYEIYFGKPFQFGTQHIYYDGPHCMFSLGLIHFCWGGNPFTGWCKKCMPDND